MTRLDSRSKLPHFRSVSLRRATGHWLFKSEQQIQWPQDQSVEPLTSLPRFYHITISSNSYVVERGEPPPEHSEARDILTQSHRIIMLPMIEKKSSLERSQNLEQGCRHEATTKMHDSDLLTETQLICEGSSWLLRDGKIYYYYYRVINCLV